MGDLDAFYKVMHGNPRPAEDKKRWIVESKILRRDTNSIVTTYASYGRTKDSALLQAQKDAPAHKPSEVPKDWQGDK